MPTPTSSATAAPSPTMSKQERHEYLVRLSFSLLYRAKLLLGAQTIMLTIGMMFVLLRLYVRARILKNFLIDDWILLGSLVSGIIGFVFSAYAESSMIWNLYNAAHVIRSFPKSDIMGRMRFQTNQVSSYHMFCAFVTLQATLGRVAILYTFHRLSASRTQQSRYLRIAIGVVAGIMVLSAIPLSYIFFDNGCVPFKITPLQKCLFLRPEKLLLVFFVWSVFNAVADLFIFTLPFIILRWARLTNGQRKGLYLLFAFGFAMILISVFRAVQSQSLIRRRAESDIILRINILPVVYAFGEANGVMVAASLPVLKPLYKMLRERITSVFRRRDIGVPEEHEMENKQVEISAPSHGLRGERV